MRGHAWRPLAHRAGTAWPCGTCPPDELNPLVSHSYVEDVSECPTMVGVSSPMHRLTSVKNGGTSARRCERPRQTTRQSRKFTQAGRTDSWSKDIRNIPEPDCWCLLVEFSSGPGVLFGSRDRSRLFLQAAYRCRHADILRTWAMPDPASLAGHLRVGGVSVEDAAAAAARARAQSLSAQDPEPKVLPHRTQTSSSLHCLWNKHSARIMVISPLLEPPQREEVGDRMSQ